MRPARHEPRLELAVEKLAAGFQTGMGDRELRQRGVGRHDLDLVGDEAETLPEVQEADDEALGLAWRRNTSRTGFLKRPPMRGGWISQLGLPGCDGRADLRALWAPSTLRLTVGRNDRCKVLHDKRRSARLAFRP